MHSVEMAVDLISMQFLLHVFLMCSLAVPEIFYKLYEIQHYAGLKNTLDSQGNESSIIKKAAEKQI